MIYFQGHDRLLKTTKIRLFWILNLAHFFKRKVPSPVKHRITWNSEFLKEEMPFLNQVYKLVSGFLSAPSTNALNIPIITTLTRQQLAHTSDQITENVAISSILVSILL